MFYVVQNILSVSVALAKGTANQAACLRSRHVGKGQA